MVESLGIVAVTGMVVSNALEARAVAWGHAFAGFCGLAATYAALIGSWPFVVAEGIWCGVALHRTRGRSRATAPEGTGG